MSSAVSIFGAFEDTYYQGGSDALLFGVKLGSDEHFEQLVNHEDAFVFEPAFGRDLPDAFFNVLTQASHLLAADLQAACAPSTTETNPRSRTKRTSRIPRMTKATSSAA